MVLQIVYIMRDPKDTAVSFYYHYRLLLGYEGDMETFFEAFKEGCGMYNIMTLKYKTSVE